MKVLYVLMTILALVLAYMAVEMAKPIEDDKANK
jgi:hypothetical protein